MATFNGKVVGGSLKLRPDCSTNNSPITTLSSGTSVTVSTVAGEQEWFHATYGNYSGYVMSRYIAITSSPLSCTVNTTSGSLRIRATPINGDTLYNAAKGATLSYIETDSSSGWYRVSSSSGTGWGSNDLLTTPSESSSGNDTEEGETGTGGTATPGKTNGDNVRLRASASTSATNLGTLENGTPLTFYAGKVYYGSGYSWYRCIVPSLNNAEGYIATRYINSTAAIGSINYDPNAAVVYAINHSENTADNELCSNTNTVFGTSTSNDCANFVHQCLCAGGLPMFDGWSYPIPNIPSYWDDYDWMFTNGGREALVNKGRLVLVPFNEVVKGDIIYTYNESASPTPYTHVTIAVTNYSSAEGGCRVCGHTANQYYAFKALNADDVRCYHVVESSHLYNDERCIDMPLQGNGGSIMT